MQTARFTVILVSEVSPHTAWLSDGHNICIACSYLHPLSPMENTMHAIFSHLSPDVHGDKTILFPIHIYRVSALQDLPLAYSGQKHLPSKAPGFLGVGVDSDPGLTLSFHT